MILGQPHTLDLAQVREAAVMEAVASQVVVTLTLDPNQGVSQTLSQIPPGKTKFKQSHQKLMELR